MHDIRFIREQPDTFDAGLKRRGLAPMASRILAIDARRRDAVTRAQELQTLRNELSRQIGKLKARGQDASAEVAEVARSKDTQTAAEADGKTAGEELDALLATLPNLPDADVPDGPDEGANAEVRRHGTPRKFAFAAKDHVALGTALGMMDFETAARMSGARFVVLSGALARLERALGAFMLDLHTRPYSESCGGCTEVSPPALVRDNALYGSGQLPKFAEDLFHTEQDLWLIPTSEVPLANLVAGKIVEDDSLPRRYTAQTLCFRSEAGAAGKDTTGMIRQHQFLKVELVSITRPEDSETEHERMTTCAEEVLKRLELPYRTVLLCTGDMGFSARKTYDIEVWLPGQNRYREISSCSDCGDFQARRMKARFRKEGQKGTQFVHTLNGSGLAVGRTLIAVLENYQRADGSIAIPEALRPYMGGLTEIRPT